MLLVLVGTGSDVVEMLLAGKSWDIARYSSKRLRDSQLHLHFAGD